MNKFYIRQKDIPTFEKGFSLNYILDGIGYKEYKNVIVSTSEEIIQSEQKIDECRKGILLGSFRDCWGHNLLDDIVRLWWTFTKEYDIKLNESFELYVFKLYGKPLSENFKKLLMYLGIDLNKIIFLSQPTHFSELIVPDKSVVIDRRDGMDGRYYFPEYQKMINHIISQVPKGVNMPSKVYFSRAHFKSKFSFMDRKGRDFGELYVEKVFQEMGYEIIYPEEHTLEEQIQMLQCCDVFAATEGSIAHNLVFAHKNVTSVVVRKSYYYNTYQSMISNMVGANVIYIDAHHTFLRVLDPWDGPFLLAVTKYIKRFSRDNGMELKSKYIIGSCVSCAKYVAECLLKALRLRKIPRIS